MTIERLRVQSAFNAQVETKAAQALGAGISSFPEFLARLPGVYPAVALNALYRMQRNGKVSANLRRMLERQARGYRSLTPIVLDSLPPPHPLDFEWRFTKRTAIKLLSLAETLANPDDRVVLFGTPAVAAMATSAPIDRPTVFVGEDNVITRAVMAQNDLNDRPLVVRTCKSQKPLPSEAGVVLVDPPWYFDFMRPMLSVAASCCRVGGVLLLSLLPIGTRPSAEQDRERILHYLRRLSLEPVEVREDDLTYETPFFEANALAAAGLFGIPNDWRKSDLLVLRKTGCSDRPIVAHPIQRQWRETGVGRMRLFVSGNGLNTLPAGPVMRSLLPGDVLPSVSRRDERRRQAQVWTSGNRIFASQRPDLVLAAARQARAGNNALNSNSSQLSKTERDEVKRLSYALLALADKEEAEENGNRLWGAPCLSGDSTSDLTDSSLTLPTTVFG
jgi:hypothetical protein